MSLGREVMRKEAKKLYKEQTKNVPKRQRVPFSKFFKHYRDLKLGKETDVPDVEVAPANEDFNFEDLVKVNDISDNSIEVVETMEEDNDS